MLEIGTLIRVARQPENFPQTIVGEVGFVDNLREAHASIQCVNLDGTISGWGDVPINCLEMEGGREWIEAVGKMINSWPVYLERVHQRNLRWKTFLEETAKEYGMSPGTVEALYHKLSFFQETEEYIDPDPEAGVDKKHGSERRRSRSHR
jgi:hypothetical protein